MDDSDECPSHDSKESVVNSHDIIDFDDIIKKMNNNL
jgi:hypothetical protein